jgi:hypothetical protein
LPGSSFLQERRYRDQLGFELGGRALMDAGTDDDHDVGAAREDRGVFAERLTNEAFCAVALHGAADLAGCHDADARLVFIEIERQAIRSRCEE